MASRSIIHIGVLGDHSTVRFSGIELEKYLRQMSGRTAVRMPRDGYKGEPDTLWVGPSEAFRDVCMSEVRDSTPDDAIVIDVENRQGIISGANPRAVLISAYRYLFYNNWYSERYKAGNMGKLMPEERAVEFADRAIEEIKRRDLLFHRAGHGWTCMPLGIAAG